MPKHLPEKETVHFVFAVKTSDGYRIEYSGVGGKSEVLEIYEAMMALKTPIIPPERGNAP